MKRKIDWIVVGGILLIVIGVMVFFLYHSRKKEEVEIKPQKKQSCETGKTSTIELFAVLNDKEGKVKIGEIKVNDCFIKTTSLSLPLRVQFVGKIKSEGGTENMLEIALLISEKSAVVAPNLFDEGQCVIFIKYWQTFKKQWISYPEIYSAKPDKGKIETYRP